MEQSLPKAMTNTMLLFSTPVYLFNDYIGADIHNTHSEQQEVVKNQEGNFSSKETNILELESYKVIKDNNGKIILKNKISNKILIIL